MPSVPTSSVHDLRNLVLSFHPLLVIETDEEARARTLTEAAARESGLGLYEWSSTRGLRDSASPDRVLGQSREPREMLAHVGTLTVEGVFLLVDFTSYLSDPHVVRLLRELCQKFSDNHSTLVMVGARFELPPELESFATYYGLQLPQADELADVVSAVAHSLERQHDIRIDLDLDKRGELVRALSGMTLNQARQTVARAALEDSALSERALEAIHNRKAELLGHDGLLEYFPAEDNGARIAGCRRLIEWLDRAQVGFSEEATALNLAPPRGVLLVGVQGCGKSLAAKIIARRWKLPLLKLDVGRLFDKYVGESERNFRQAVTQAEAMAPTVLWLDEIEKAFGLGSGASEGDGGLTRRLFGFFLTWLQEKKADVFVVATANDLSRLPPELLRKGRFDEIFFVDLPTAEARREILEIHLNLRKQDPTALDLHALVLVSEGFSGAELEQAVISGLYRALHAKESLTTEFLLREITETVPLSISRREDVERLRSTARERFVPVD